MFWIEAGGGPPVVLIHGIPTSPSLWRKVIPLLPRVRALAWEMVGHGQSIQEAIEASADQKSNGRSIDAEVNSASLDVRTTTPCRSKRDGPNSVLLASATWDRS